VDLDRQKSALRKQSLRSRDALPEQARAHYSSSICDRAFAIIASKKVDQIHCYLSFRSEVATNQLIAKLHSANIKVTVPSVREGGAMVHLEHLPDDLLIEKTFGIREPVEQRTVLHNDFDVVFLPLAAFDRKGVRLGYGRGFYDYFLKTLPKDTLRIGLAFASQEVSNVPREEHDALMDFVITEKELIDCSDLNIEHTVTHG
jgi:5-formyltetrahydrofolate cyclo-ligase